MKKEQQRIIGHALSAIYEKLKGSKQTDFLHNIVKLDNIMHTSISTEMVKNWIPNTSMHPYAKYGMEPYLGDPAWFLNRDKTKYLKGVIIEKTPGFTPDTYICKVNIIERNESHYISTEDIYLNNPIKTRHE